jgi:hypothetical protein
MTRKPSRLAQPSKDSSVVGLKKTSSNQRLTATFEFSEKY